MGKEKRISRVDIANNNEPWTPKDGGVKAWIVVACSFLINGLILGSINSYSVIYFELQKNLENAGVADSSSKASLVGSLTIGATFALSPVAGILTDKFGLRQTALLGGGLAAVGMAASSFLCDTVEALYFTYGILFGLGASLAYTPSLAILGLHFRQKMGMVNGLVTAGSSVFTIFLPPLLGGLLPVIGLQGVLRVMAVCMAFIMVAALLFKIPEGAVVKKPVSSSHTSLKLSSIINVEIWKSKRYVIWALALSSALIGYFVPYVHMTKFVSMTFPDRNGAHLVMCIGITSGVGRLIFGKIADIPRVNKILLQQISFVSIGVLTMLLTVASNWWWLVAIALGMGLFDGCFISLLGPIAIELCGPENGAQAIGFMFGFLSIPLTLGPPIAGLLFDHTQSYFLPFILSGCPLVLGGLILFAVRCVPPREPTNNDKNLQTVTSISKGSSALLNSLPVDYTLISGAEKGGTATAGEMTSLLENKTGVVRNPIYVERLSSL